MLIENGILKAYDGDMKNVVIPEGVRVIAGNVEDSDRGKHLQGVKTDGVLFPLQRLRLNRNCEPARYSSW